MAKGSWQTNSKGQPVWVENVEGRELDQSLLDKEKLQDVSGLSAAIKARGGQEQEAPPKQKDGEGLGAYSTRLREWREKNAAMKGQKKALSE